MDGLKLGILAFGAFVLYATITTYRHYDVHRSSTIDKDALLSEQYYYTYSKTIFKSIAVTKYIAQSVVYNDINHLHLALEISGKAPQHSLLSGIEQTVPIEVLHKMLEFGADLNDYYAFDTWGTLAWIKPSLRYTPIDYAIACKNDSAIKLLTLAGADTSYYEEFGRLSRQQHEYVLYQVIPLIKNMHIVMEAFEQKEQELTNDIALHIAKDYVWDVQDLTLDQALQLIETHLPTYLDAIEASHNSLDALRAQLNPQGEELNTADEPLDSDALAQF